MARYKVAGGIHGEKWIPPDEPQGPTALWDGMGPQIGLPKYRVVWPVGTWRDREERELAAHDELCEDIDCEFWGIERSPDNITQVIAILAESGLQMRPGRTPSEPSESESEEQHLLRITYSDGSYQVKTLNDLRHEKESAGPGERIPGEQIGPGRRPKYEGDHPGQTLALLVGHTNKALDDNPWASNLEGAEFWQVADALLNIIFARADKANPKLLAQWLPMGKSTIYNRRKKGNGESAMFLEQLDRIESMVERTQALVEDLHWAEQQGRVEPDPTYIEDEHPLE